MTTMIAAIGAPLSHGMATLSPPAAWAAMMVSIGLVGALLRRRRDETSRSV
jgi:hypothetical protein